MDDSKFTFFVLLILIILLVSITFLTSSHYETRASIAATNQDYSDVQVSSCHYFFSDWYGCSPSDGWACKAKAKNSNGQNVDITVCTGWVLKGSTIRTN